MEKLVLIPAIAQQELLDKVRSAMIEHGITYAIVSSNTNIYYLTGRVFSGYILLSIDHDPIYLTKRPSHLSDNRAFSIHKPENITDVLSTIGITLPDQIGLELNNLSYNMANRLIKALKVEKVSDFSDILSQVRATKIPFEIAKIRESGIKHQEVYHHIPNLYEPGMTDLELQVEIEHLSRLEGCLGQFRIGGTEMELFMGNVLTGNNADTPAPFDFAMGGGGVDPSLPIGANGTVIKPGMTVMVDMNGNFTGYMTDMTRCYSVGEIKEQALLAHKVSIDICSVLSEMGRPGVEAKALYNKALEIAKTAGLEEFFMGHRQHAGFVGHGIGIEINELPVISPRSHDILKEGNVIAIEPKFVVPEVGAVGIENTYIVKKEGPMECLTPAPEEIIKLD